MATIDRTRSHRDAATFRGSDVCLRLAFIDSCSPTEIEDAAVLIQDAVDEHAEGLALGAAVRCTFEPPAVELIFTVEATSMAEVQHRVASVIAAIEPELPFGFAKMETAASADAPGREPVSA